ncbi:hypothetical protein CDAR_276461 [Caerostris darwini]|uniref:Uncharacterized protein n=1 Tax=Caerostris darwini TaxID=1538125 RepID=A0AAV4N174_9ARAC|nr:hypothetical protein CDAR_276461 [Caerostris darwini]
MISVLLEVSTGTSSTPSEESLLVGTNAPVTSQQLVYVEVPLYARDLYFREQCKDLSSFCRFGPAVLPFSHNFLFDEVDIIIGIYVDLFFHGCYLGIFICFFIASEALMGFDSVQMNDAIVAGVGWLGFYGTRARFGYAAPNKVVKRN